MGEIRSMTQRLVFAVIFCFIWPALYIASCTNLTVVPDAVDREPTEVSYDGEISVTSDILDAGEFYASELISESIQDAANAELISDFESVEKPNIPRVTVPISQRLCVANPEVYGSDSFARSQLTWMAQKLKEAGVSWLRYQLFWHHIEAKKGTFDFSRYDRVVEIMGAAGIGLVGVLAYGNPWASSKTKDDPYFPPDDPADFARYAKATVQHYKGRITRWEIWNEPNAGYRFWKTEPHGDPVGYAKLLVAASKAIKETDPSSVVAFGGPFFHEFVIMGAIPFITQAFAAQPSLATLLDRMSAHPYPHYPPVDEPEDGRENRIPLWMMLSETSKFLPKQPLWITEMGWPSYYLVDTTKQAEFLSRAFVLAFASGSELVCWYKFADTSGAALFPAEHLFGMFEVSADWQQQPPAPKPAYRALKTIHTFLGQATTLVDMRSTWGLQTGEYGYRFVMSNSETWVLWRQAAQSAREITLILSTNSTATVYDVLGEKLTISPQQSGSEHRLVLPLRTGPSFVVVVPKVP